MKPPRKLIISKDPKQVEADLNLILTDVYKRFGSATTKKVGVVSSKIVTGRR